MVLAPGEAVHGVVCFASPVARGFQEAILQLRFVAVEGSSEVVVRLPLQGVGGDGRVSTP